MIAQNKETTTDENKHSLMYRPDIDGLRTIAISIVLIFHAWPKKLCGGFVGVDVFFVISGYLISSIILKEYQDNKFSYTNFYYKRIKRLFPALLILFFAVIAIAYLQLWDNEIKSLSKTIIAGSLFGANLQILFLKKGYFDPDTQENPLLHLWSLGVEEQFYMIWPLVIFLLTKTSKLNSYILITFFFIVSFLANIFAINTNTKWAYYFPLCRFWEMIIGSYIALINHHEKGWTCESSPLKMHFLSFFGFFLIILSSVLVNENNLFPGFWAILPTMGAAMMICSSNGFINNYLLNTKIFIFIGKISYPLYLWHWPLLVLGKIIMKNFPNFIYSTEFLVVLSFILSILTYFFIEKPINSIKSKIRVFAILSIGMSFVLLMGVCFLMNPVHFSRLSYQRYLFNSKVDLKVTNVASNFFRNEFQLNKYNFKNQTSLPKLMTSTYWDKEGTFERLIPITEHSKKHYTYLGNHPTYIFNEKKDSKKVIIVGDSFAEMIIFRIKYVKDSKIIKNFPTVIFKVVSGSWIGFPCDEDEIISNNLKAHNELIEYIKKIKPMSVFFCSKPYTGLYPKLIDDNEMPDKNNKCNIKSTSQPDKFSKKKVENLFNKLIKNLKSISDLGVRLYMNTLKPEGDLFNPVNMFNNFGVLEKNIQPVKYSTYMNNYKEYKHIIDKAIQKSGAVKIDFSENMCKNDICPVIDSDGFPVNRDSSHLSYHFVKNYLNVIDQVFMEK